MRIRDYIEGRRKFAKRFVFWGTIGLGISMAAWSTFWEGEDFSIRSKIVFGLGILLIVFGAVAYQYLSKCPRCGGGLSMLVSRAVGKKPKLRDSCPHCDVSLDEAVDGPAREPVLDKIVTIRKVVEARANKMALFLLPGLPFLVYGVVVVPNWSTQQTVLLAVGSGFSLIGAIAINRTPCPVCGKALGMVASRNAWQSEAACTTCGTDIDAPINR